MRSRSILAFFCLTRTLTVSGSALINQQPQKPLDEKPCLFFGSIVNTWLLSLVAGSGSDIILPLRCTKLLPKAVLVSDYEIKDAKSRPGSQGVFLRVEATHRETTFYDVNAEYIRRMQGCSTADSEFHSCPVVSAIHGVGTRLMYLDNSVLFLAVTGTNGNQLIDAEAFAAGLDTMELRSLHEQDHCGLKLQEISDKLCYALVEQNNPDSESQVQGSWKILVGVLAPPDLEVYRRCGLTFDDTIWYQKRREDKRWEFY